MKLLRFSKKVPLVLDVKSWEFDMVETMEVKNGIQIYVTLNPTLRAFLIIPVNNKTINENTVCE